MQASNSFHLSQPNATGTEDFPAEVFRLAVEQAAIAIAITDLRAKIIYVNPSFARITGYSQQELLGQNQSLLSYKVTPKTVYQNLWDCLEKQESWSGLLVNRRKDGSRYLADLTITPVLNSAGETTHYLGMQRDVTELHQLEKQISNQQRLMESALDATQAAMVMLDDTGQPLLTNRSYQDLAERLQQDPLPLLIQALQRETPDGFDLPRALRQGFAETEIQLPSRQELPLWLNASGEVIEVKDTSADAYYAKTTRPTLLITLQDISYLKHQQNQLQMTSLQALLAEQDRLQSVREALLGAVFHLERPLNLVNAALRLVGRRDRDENPALLGLLAEVQEAGQEALEQLTRSVPDTSQEARQSVNLNQLIKNTLSLMTPRLLASGVELDWQPQSDLPSIEGRPTALVNLFKQLLDNAVDALVEGRCQQREIRLITRQVTDMVEVIIEDTGHGISAADQFRVFEPFYTSRMPGSGHLGMGLTLAQEIVNNHQGLLEIDPDYVDGCRLKVLLPYV